MSLRSPILWFACSLLSCIASVAYAGPVERMADIALHPTDPDRMVVRYLNGGSGLLYTSDGGRSFRLLCASAIDINKPSGPIALAGDGQLVMAEFKGLRQDDGQGCGWRVVPELAGRRMTDLTNDPTNPARILAISGTGEDAQNGIIRRDESQQWADYGTQEPVILTRIVAAKTMSGLRLYASALRVQMAADGGMLETKYLVRMSDDEGKTWTEHAVEAKDGSFRLEGVDPTNPDRILGSISREGKPDDLLLSRDRGQTFTPYIALTDLGGLTFAPDGRLWVAEPASVSMPEASRGLWFTASLDAPLTKVAQYGVECIAYSRLADALFACQAYSFGRVDLTTSQFTEMFHFRTAREFVSCGGSDMATMCKQQLCAEYCGAGHFAQSKLCCAYTDSACGPAVAELEGTGTRADCGDIAGGAAGTGAAGSMSGASGTGTAGMAGAAAGSTAGTGSTAAGAPAPGGSAKNGGCSCNLAAPASSDSGGWSLIAAALTVVVVTRCRRRYVVSSRR